MKIDLYSKFILTVIALGLLLNGVNPWLRPSPAESQLMPVEWVQPSLSYVELDPLDLRNIKIIMTSINYNLMRITNGRCPNPKLC